MHKILFAKKLTAVICIRMSNDTCLVVWICFACTLPGWIDRSDESDEWW